jgi:hypothetical protein
MNARKVVRQCGARVSKPTDPVPKTPGNECSEMQQ